MQHRNIQYPNIALYAIVFFDLITVIYLICGIIRVWQKLFEDGNDE